jgi:hypothetical protein
MDELNGLNGFNIDINKRISHRSIKKGIKVGDKKLRGSVKLQLNF